MSNLKPCPFCGGEAEVNYGQTSSLLWAYVTCGCGIRTCNHHGDKEREAKAKAIETWNRRANDGD